MRRETLASVRVLSELTASPFWHADGLYSRVYINPNHALKPLLRLELLHRRYAIHTRPHA